MSDGLLNPKNAADPMDAVASSMRGYVEKNAAGEKEPAFTKETSYGQLISVGNAKFMLSPYRKGKDAASELPGVLSLQQLLDLDLVTPEAAIEGLLFAGETIVIAGRPKVGKTRLTHQLAVAIVKGTDFLGMKASRPRRVLLVDLENRRWAIKDRLLRMIGKSDKLPGLFVWCADSLHADVINAKGDGIDKLKQMILDCGAEVVVIDPWRLFVGGDENSAENVLGGLRAVARLRESRPDLTIIIVHHVRKDRLESPRDLVKEPRAWIEAISGHSALMSHVDGCFGLERQKDENGEEMIAFAGIARNIDPRLVLLEDDEESLRFNVRRDEDVLKTVLTPTEYGFWTVATKVEGPFGFGELLERAGQKNKKALSRMLKQAVRLGLILKEQTRYVVVNPSANGIAEL